MSWHVWVRKENTKADCNIVEVAMASWEEVGFAKVHIKFSVVPVSSA